MFLFNLRSFKFKTEGQQYKQKTTWKSYKIGV